MTEFDYNAPLPPLNIRQSRSWEPAARHYQDLTPEDEAAEQELADDFERNDHA